jgi:hypothetical protein
MPTLSMVLSGHLPAVSLGGIEPSFRIAIVSKASARSAVSGRDAGLTRQPAPARQQHSTCRPGPQQCPSFTSNLSEYPMLNSQSAIAAVRRHSSPEQAARAAPRDRRDIPAERLTPAAEISKAEAKLLPETRPAAAQPDAICPLVYWFFLEGFALYGASVHGLATSALTAIAGEVGARRPPEELSWRKRRKSISLVSSAAGAEMAVLESEGAVGRMAFGSGTPSTRDAAAREFNRYRFVHPGWLNRTWRAIASRWANWRREREIIKIVTAVAEYDDRTLRDMGFSNRSQIEQIVRNGRDD